MRGQPLTFEQERIEFHLRAHDSLRKITTMLHRDHSVSMLELERNTCRDGTYSASKAKEYAEKPEFILDNLAKYRDNSFSLWSN